MHASHAAASKCRLGVKALCFLPQILGIPVIRVAGVEADDVIGTVASRAIDDGFLVAIASPDKVHNHQYRSSS